MPPFQGLQRRFIIMSYYHVIPSGLHLNCFEKMIFN